MKYPLVLASQSPRRKELLSYLVPEFDVKTADIDESVLEDESGLEYVKRLALEKARKVAHDNPNSTVLGSDTAVVFKHHILGKPDDLEECVATLSLLSEQTHQVYTAFAIVTPEKEICQVVTTDVLFKSLTVEEIEAYWHTGEPQDKAGSYAIQGIGGKFVKSINGSVSAVIGLPLVEVEDALNMVME